MKAAAKYEAGPTSAALLRNSHPVLTAATRHGASLVVRNLNNRDPDGTLKPTAKAQATGIKALLTSRLPSPFVSAVNQVLSRRRRRAGWPDQAGAGW